MFVSPETASTPNALDAETALSTYALLAASSFAVGVLTVTVFAVSVNVELISLPVIRKFGSIEIFLILVNAISGSPSEG